MDSDQDEWCWDDLSQDAVCLIALYVAELDRIWFRDMTEWTFQIATECKLVTDRGITPAERIRCIPCVYTAMSMERDPVYTTTGFVRGAFSSGHPDCWMISIRRLGMVYHSYGGCSRPPNLASMHQCAAARWAAMGGHHDLADYVLNQSDPEFQDEVQENIIVGIIAGGHRDELELWDIEWHGLRKRNLQMWMPVAQFCDMSMAFYLRKVGFEHCYWLCKEFHDKTNNLVLRRLHLDCKREKRRCGWSCPWMDEWNKEHGQ